MFKYHQYIYLLAFLILSSCVSTKKHEALQSSLYDVQSKYAELLKADEENARLIQDLKDKEEELVNLQAKYKSASRELENYLAANRHLQAQYDELLSSKEQVMNTAIENRSMLDEKERELAEQKNRLEELQSRLNDQASYLSDIKENIRNAILGYSSEDLSLHEKEGKLYVSLSENLLFAKGSSTLDSRGKEAIGKIATALRDNKDLNLEVQGHTDSDGSERLNWKLSTDRALSVLQEMTKSGVDASNITASGRAFYDPVAPNDSESNKSKNRRTEIILAPKLNEIFQYLENR